MVMTREQVRTAKSLLQLARRHEDEEDARHAKAVADLARERRDEFLRILADVCGDRFLGVLHDRSYGPVVAVREPGDETGSPRRYIAGFNADDKKIAHAALMAIEAEIRRSGGGTK